MPEACDTSPWCRYDQPDASSLDTAAQIRHISSRAELEGGKGVHITPRDSLYTPLAGDLQGLTLITVKAGFSACIPAFQVGAEQRLWTRHLQMHTIWTGLDPGCHSANVVSLDCSDGVEARAHVMHVGLQASPVLQVSIDRCEDP